MANHASAQKASRQANRRRARNQAGLAKVRTTVKKVRTAAEGKKGKEVLLPLLNEAQRILMKAASKNLIKKGNASRHISRLSALVHKAVGA